MNEGMKERKGKERKGREGKGRDGMEWNGMNACACMHACMNE